MAGRLNGGREGCRDAESVHEILILNEKKKTLTLKIFFERFVQSNFVNILSHLKRVITAVHQAYLAQIHALLVDITSQHTIVQ